MEPAIGECVGLVRGNTSTCLKVLALASKYQASYFHSTSERRYPPRLFTCVIGPLTLTSYEKGMKLEIFCEQHHSDIVAL